MSRVAILGASPKEGRYARKAQELLVSKGHEAIPVNERYDEVLGLPCWDRLTGIPGEIDTVTVYLAPRHQDERLKQELIRKRPRRVIFNPGTENRGLESALRTAGIEVEEACTLVMLSTGVF